ncbi:MAG: hypothetical protein ACYS8I_03280 [Planctomycetota bacterium]|jgi:hypothetical protein
MKLMNNTKRCLVGVCVLSGMGFLIALIAFSSAQASESVSIKLKAQTGDTYKREYRLVSRTAQEQQGYAPRTAEQTVTIIVSSEVISVNRKGRIEIEQKLDRLKYEQFFPGRGRSIFDSANPAHMEAAREDAGLAFLLASLGSHWILVLEPNGEVWDEEFHIPGTGQDTSTEFLTKNFLKQFLNMAYLSFPSGAVRRGDNWECGTIDLPTAGGRLIGAVQCALEKIRKQGGKSTAVISVKRSVKLKPTAGNAVRSKLLKHEEGGSFTFLIDRGEVGVIDLEGKSIIEADIRGNTVKRTTTNELTVTEARR